MAFSIKFPKPLNPDVGGELVHVSFERNIEGFLSDHNEYVTKIRTLQRIHLTNSCESPIMTIDDFETDTDWLQTLYYMGFKYACVWFQGNWPNGEEFEQEAVTYCDSLEGDWLAAGHILARQNRYPKWHHQTIIINLKTWAEKCYFEDIIETENPDMPLHGYKLSAEHIHDNYTPMWFKGDGTELDEYIQDNMDYDENYFQVMFKIAGRLGLTLYNLPHDVRCHKTCIYIEDDIEETSKWFLDNQYLLGADVNDVLRERRRIERDYTDKSDLFTYKSQPFQILYATNTEGVPGEKIEMEAPYNVMAVPCSGLHQFLFMASSLDTMERVIWFDFAELSTRWVKRVLEEWDGRDFTKFLDDRREWLYGENEILSYGKDTNIIYEEELYLEFIEAMGGEEQWLKTWDKIRSLQHDFLVVDIVQNGQRLVEEIGHDNNVFLNVTNIWSYESNYINSKHFDAEAGFINLINNVRKNNKKLVIKGDSPSGMHYFENVDKIKGFV